MRKSYYRRKEILPKLKNKIGGDQNIKVERSFICMISEERKEIFGNYQILNSKTKIIYTKINP